MSQAKILLKYIRIGMLQSIQKAITAENSHGAFPEADTLDLAPAGLHRSSFTPRSIWCLQRLRDFHLHGRTVPWCHSIRFHLRCSTCITSRSRHPRRRRPHLHLSTWVGQQPACHLIRCWTCRTPCRPLHRLLLPRCLLHQLLRTVVLLTLDLTIRGVQRLLRSSDFQSVCIEVLFSFFKEK